MASAQGDSYHPPLTLHSDALSTLPSLTAQARSLRQVDDAPFSATSQGIFPFLSFFFPSKPLHSGRFKEEKEKSIVI